MENKLYIACIIFVSSIVALMIQFHTFSTFPNITINFLILLAMAFTVSNGLWFFIKTLKEYWNENTK